MRGILLLPIGPPVIVVDWNYPHLIKQALRKAADEKLMKALAEARRERIQHAIRSRAELN